MLAADWPRPRQARRWLAEAEAHPALIRPSIAERLLGERRRVPAPLRAHGPARLLPVHSALTLSKHR